MIDFRSAQFATEYWGKRAAELVISNIPINEGDVFSALRQYAVCADDIRFRNAQSEALTVLNGVRTSKPRPDFLVLAEDKIFDDYVTRIDHLAGDCEWAVMYYGMHAASPAIWDAVKSFSDQLALLIGYRPGGRVDVDCFVGRYSSTYVGIHVDHAHNFGFTLRDGKTMFTWPGARSDLLGVKFPDYEQFKSESVPLENKTDRVAYFPQDWLHVAETQSGPSANVNIAFWEADDDAQKSVNYVKRLLHVPDRTRHDVRSSGMVNLNPDDEFLLSSLKRVLSVSSLRRRMMVSQLISDTSGRLNVGRPLVEVEKVDDVITLNSVSTLQWMPVLEAAEVLIAANGHCASFEYDHRINDFLRQLAAGKQVSISHFLGEFSSQPNNNFQRVVAALARWGAI
jgi:hypothetical protein